MRNRLLPLIAVLLGVGFTLPASAQDAASKGDASKGDASKSADGAYKVEIKRAPASSPAPAATDGAAKEAPKQPSRTPGYTWTDPPRKRSWRRARIDPNWAIATFPGFRMLPDGSSEVSVWLSKKVKVDIHKQERSVTLVLSDTYVRWRNNTYPLITTHFNTPLGSARLKRGKHGETLLIIQLRETADVKSRLEVGPRGTAILKVAIPRPRQVFVEADQRVPLAVLPR